MTTYQRMIKKLKPLNIYKLDGNTKMDSELKIYSSFIDQVNVFIESLLGACFVDNINGNTIKRFQKMYALPLIYDNDILTSIIKKKIAVNNGDFTMEGVLRSLDSGGIVAEISENFPTNTVTVKVLSDMKLFTDSTERTNFIKSCLPCHVNVVII